MQTLIFEWYCYWKTNFSFFLDTLWWVQVLVINNFIGQTQPVTDFRPAGQQGKLLISFNLVAVQLGSIWDVLRTKTKQESEIFLLVADFCQQCAAQAASCAHFVIPAGAGRVCSTPNLFHVFCSLNLLNRVHLKQPQNTNYSNSYVVGGRSVKEHFKCPGCISYKIPTSTQSSVVCSHPTAMRSTTLSQEGKPITKGKPNPSKAGKC